MAQQQPQPQPFLFPQGIRVYVWVYGSSEYDPSNYSIHYIRNLASPYLTNLINLVSSSPSGRLYSPTGFPIRDSNIQTLQNNDLLWDVPFDPATGEPVETPIFSSPVCFSFYFFFIPTSY